MKRLHETLREALLAEQNAAAEAGNMENAEYIAAVLDSDPALWDLVKITDDLGYGERDEDRSVSRREWLGHPNVGATIS